MIRVLNLLYNVCFIVFYNVNSLVDAVNVRICTVRGMQILKGSLRELVAQMSEPSSVNTTSSKWLQC